MAASPLTSVKFHSTLASGADNNGGKVFTYAAGTTTPQATYTDAGGGTPNANPVILDATGRASIYLNPALSYKFVITDSAGSATPDGTVDNWTDPGAVVGNLASTAAGKGASLVGVQDAASNFPEASPKNVETVLAAIAGRAYGVNVLKYGADRGGSTDSTSAFVSAAAESSVIYVPDGTYAINWSPSTKFVLVGDGNTYSLLKPYNTATAAITYKSNTPYWSYHTEVRDIGFIGSSKVGVGFTFGKTDPTGYAVGDEYFNNVQFYNCRWTGLKKGVQFPFGNIGSAFYDCGWTGNFYGVYSLNNKFYPGTPGATLMHAGNKYIYGGQMDSNDCAIYCHNGTSADGFGGFVLQDTIVEQNNINGYFYSNNTGEMPIELRGVWQEQSGAALGGSTTLDQWSAAVLSTASFTNHAWIFDGDASTYVFNGGGIFGDVNLIATNSRVVASNVKTESLAANNGGPCLVTDSSSEITIVNPTSTRGVATGPRVFCEGYLKATSVSASADAGTRWAQIRHRYSKAASYGGNGSTQKFTGAITTTGLVLVGALVTDGPLYTQCNEYTEPGGHAGTFATIPSTSVTPTATGSWLVATVMVKWVSGAAPLLYVGDLSTNQTFAGATVPETGVWYTLGGLAQTLSTSAQAMQFAGSASASVFRLAAAQIRNFATRAEAQAFLASTVYVES